MDRLGTTHAPNVGSNNDKQHDYFTSVITAIKAVLISLAAWLSVGVVIL